MWTNQMSRLKCPNCGAPMTIKSYMIGIGTYGPTIIDCQYDCGTTLRGDLMDMSSQCCMARLQQDDTVEDVI